MRLQKFGYGQRMQLIRKRRGFTQQDIADRLTISVVSYARYEGEEREPNLETLLKIADIYDVSIDYLCGRTDNPNAHKQ